MITLEKTEVFGYEHAIRGMRNPMNSWEKSDTGWVDCDLCDDARHRDVLAFDFDNLREKVIGPNDHELMMKLAKGGPVHAKYRRMINVYVDIKAPLYWWKEFDTYKVGTVANSCSTMHKIHAKEFELDDFSHEHLTLIHAEDFPLGSGKSVDPLNNTIDFLNEYRNRYLRATDQEWKKKYWWQMIQLLPSSYNQLRTVMLNYEVLVGIYKHRKNHKLDEWREFCAWIEKLPYSELITLEEGKEDE